MSVMARYKHLTTEERRIDFNMWKNGDSMRRIASCICHSSSSVSCALTKYRQSGSFDACRRCGGSRPTTRRVDKRIFVIVRRNKHIIAAAVQAALVQEGKSFVHKKTVQRRIKEEWYQARKPRRLPLVSKANKTKRLEFHQLYILKDLSLWRRVLWSDESNYAITTVTFMSGAKAENNSITCVLC